MGAKTLSIRGFPRFRARAGRRDDRTGRSSLPAGRAVAASGSLSKYHAPVPKAASNALRVALSLGLAAVLLWLFFRSLDLAELGRALSGARPAGLAVALVITVVNVPLRAWRWIRLLHHVERVSFRESFVATTIGFAASVLLPARAGEIVRPAVLSRRTGLPFAPALASIAVERLIDLVTVVLLFVVYAAGGWAPSGLSPEAQARLELLRRSALVVGAGALAVFAGLGLLAARPALAERFLVPLERRLPERFAARIVSLLRSFLGGLAAIRTGRDVAVLAVSSLVMWLLNALQFHVVAGAFGIQLAFPISFFVMTWAVLGLAIPTPGGVGGYHAAVAYALTGFYGVATAPAAATALATHAIAFVPITVAGAFLVAASGLTFRRLAATGSSDPEPSGSSLRP